MVDSKKVAKVEGKFIRCCGSFWLQFWFSIKLVCNFFDFDFVPQGFSTFIQLYRNFKQVDFKFSITFLREFSSQGFKIHNRSGPSVGQSQLGMDRGNYRFPT